jgi:hypothetical protein
MSADLVPVSANVAELETLTPEAREIAVTHMLDEARSWLAHAVEATEPKRISEFKAFVATIAESARQLKLAKGIQLDAEEMVRRAERGKGLAIRRAQEAGEIFGPNEGGGLREGEYVRIRHGREETVRVTQPALRDPNRGSPKEFFAHGTDWNLTYAVTDGVSNEQFEASLAEAKAEQNLSRANVVRKVRTRVAADQFAESADLSTREGRAKRVADLAAQNYSSRQIADLMHIHFDTVRVFAREYGIEVPADRAIGKTRRHDPNRIVEETVHALDGLRMGLELVDFTGLDRSKIPHWSSSLRTSLRSLNRFLKELDQ